MYPNKPPVQYNASTGLPLYEKMSMTSRERDEFMSKE